MPANPVQHTLARAATITGRGLLGGQPARLTFKPAPLNHGLVFSRTDLGGKLVPALVQHIVKRARRSTLRCGDATVDTTEHCLSAAAGLGLDNLLIELDAPETPNVDGSAAPFAAALLEAGLQPQDAPRTTMVVSEPVMVRLDDQTLAAVPSDEPGLQIMYDLDYTGTPALGRQVFTFRLGGAAGQDYASQIAPARTFVLEAEVQALLSKGMGQHLTASDVLVVGPDGPVAPNRFHFPNEAVRHKILDLIGDLALLGAPIQGRIIASRSGHALNHVLVRALAKQWRQQTHQALAVGRNIMDARRLLNLLPHRYPMLLVDRVVELDADRRVLGVKNVTLNEPFFHGHFPGLPIMPGVLIVEAMAQLSGVLIAQKLENQGKVAILLSLDRVKLRRPVVPGDQLFLEAEAVKLRASIAHTRCRAYVGQDLAAEAEVKFMIVDAKGI
jgi:UDP-3-O-[3-hydroxymyristoyl] N-acetylglucosamine deacetylase / 3-hydroxyacyl-[acyl-carrier-protein] dehydratase